MPTEDFIIQLFCLVDDRRGPQRRHSQARLWPSARVPSGLLFALQGGAFRAFYRWLARDYAPLFGGRPERTRLLRARQARHQWTTRFLAEPTFFTVLDTYGIELLHPGRYGRSPRQVGRKGWSNHRWIVGLKRCWLINCRGEIVAGDWNPAKRPDQDFAPVAAPCAGTTSTLADEGFRQAKPRPETRKLCPRGTWNERLLVETVLPLVHRVCRLKYLWHRARPYWAMHRASGAALFNALLALNTQDASSVGDEVPWPCIAQYTL